MRDLRAPLDLDSGYLSRLLRSLERAGLAKTQADPEDGRVRAVRLTRPASPNGRLSTTRATTLAWSLIEPLNQAQRARLLEAMTTVERLLTAGLVEIADRGSGECRRAAVHRGLLRDPPRAVRRRLRPCREHPRRRGGPRPPRRPAPGGSAARQPVGCGALKLHGRRPAEIKRMWVSADARGLGLGRRLLAELERRGVGARGAADPARDQPLTAGGHLALPVVRLRRGAGVQRRALRPPLVREGTPAAAALTRPEACTAGRWSVRGSARPTGGDPGHRIAARSLRVGSRARSATGPRRPVAARRRPGGAAPGRVGPLNARVDQRYRKRVTAANGSRTAVACSRNGCVVLQPVGYCEDGGLERPLVGILSVASFCRGRPCPLPDGGSRMPLRVVRCGDGRPGAASPPGLAR